MSIWFTSRTPYIAAWDGYRMMVVARHGCNWLGVHTLRFGSIFNMQIASTFVVLQNLILCAGYGGAAALVESLTRTAEHACDLLVNSGEAWTDRHGI